MAKMNGQSTVDCEGYECHRVLCKEFERGGVIGLVNWRQNIPTEHL